MLALLGRSACSRGFGAGRDRVHPTVAPSDGGDRVSDLPPFLVEGEPAQKGRSAPSENVIALHAVTVGMGRPETRPRLPEPPRSRVAGRRRPRTGAGNESRTDPRREQPIR